MEKNLNVIYERRSIRAYEPGAIPEPIVTEMLKAAMAAPSAVCKDPWHFIVVRNRQTLDRMGAGLPNAPMLKDATAAIVVCGDMNKAHDGLLSYMLQDCSAAIENLLIAADVLGVGACWLGVHPREERIALMREIFGLPGHVVPVSAIALGWPGEEKEARTRYRKEVVHQEQW